MSPEPGTDISIVIPVLGAGDLLRRCLASVAACRPRALETIVVFDGEPPDRSLEEPGVSIVALPEWSGPSRARNAGAERARGRVVLFLDADLTVPSDLLAKVESAFAGDPAPAAVFGSYDTRPGAPNFLSQYKNLFHHFVHQSSKEEASTFFSACGAIRRDVFFSVGGFEESRRWMEDIELGYRLRAHGHRIRLDKSVTVSHNKVWRVGSMLRSDIFHRALPWAALIRERKMMSGELNLDWRSRLSAALVFALLAALIAAWWLPRSWVAATLFALGLLALNWRLYRFFRRQRGVWFAVRVVPWHWLYYVYSSIAFAVGTLFYRAPWGTGPGGGRTSGTS